MKQVFLLISLIFAHQAFAVCSSPIARTNFSANQVLTSTRLNTDLNAAYTRANELPGDCITSESITTTQIDDGTIVAADVSGGLYASISPKIYHTALQASGLFTTDMTDASPYMLGSGNAPNTDTVSVVGNSWLNTVYIDSADYPAITGKTVKLRIRAELFANDTAPGVTFTVGLYPLTRPASSGIDNYLYFTIGTVVTGSNGAVFTTPAADSIATTTSSDFALPANGHYAIGVKLSGGTGLIVLNADVLLSAKLQVVYAD